MEQQPDIEVGIAKLQAFGERLLAALGVPLEHAALTLETLIEADLRGVESHGVAHLVDFYVRRLQAGHIEPRPRMEVDERAPATAVLRAGRGLGFVAAHRAMDLAMAKARETGVGFVAVRDSTHYGAGFHYALKAARDGMVGISVTTGGNIVIPPGGQRRTYGANVISVAAPTDRGFTFVLDGSTSAVAGGKLEIARRRGRPIPEGWALDEEGRATTDPFSFLRGGGLLPLGSSPEMGAYKGFGFGIAADVLSGVLSGMGPSLALAANGAAAHCLAALRVDAFLPQTAYLEQMGRLVDGLKGAERQPGVAEILIPGELEGRLEAERRARGSVPLHPDIVDGYREAAAELGVSFDLL